MTRHIDLGVFAGTSKSFRADLDIILRSNLLVQANSGGGKSWLLRRMIEQSFGRVPQIIIDPEGEFSTLRQKFDLVLVGKGGDTPADLRSAQLLAHRLLELGTSAVVDLFEMSKGQRPLWVAAFVQALVDAPKKLWRDLLVYVDEAHELAPEMGHGAHESSAEKTCRHALIDLAAKGRKRGYGVIAATQRLGKLSKDFAAELKNVFVGQTFIDIDRERAAGSLGVAKADKVEFFTDVKVLTPGMFYVLGRALDTETALVKIGDVQTEHPEAGRRQSAPPPPTEKIRHLLPQLADLPKEAEDKLQTEKELKARIVELERHVAAAPSAQALAVLRDVHAWTKDGPLHLDEEDRKKLRGVLEGGTAKASTKAPRIVHESVLEKADLQRLERSVEKAAKGVAALDGVIALIEHHRDRLAQSQQVVASSMSNLSAVLGKAKNGVPERAPPVVISTPGSPRRQALAKAFLGGTPPPSDSDTDLPKYALDLLNVVAQRGKASDVQISALSGYRRTSSAFGKMLGKLAAAGLITGEPRERTITEAGRERAGAVEALPTGQALLDHWLARLTGYEALFLKTIHEAGTITREDLSARTNRSMNSSAFGKTIGALQRLALVDGPRGGDLTIAESFFT